MVSATGRTFKIGDDYAVRLPAALAFAPDVELTLIRSGDVLTLYPSRPSPAELLARLAALHRPDRCETRDEEPLPERPGL